MKLVGLTGNIGCGKSTVVSMLTEYPSIKVFSCDNAAREIIQRPELAERLLHVLGVEAFEEGKLVLPLMVKVIFSDFRKKRQLESVVNPLVWEEISKESRVVPPEFFFVVESAMIYENSWQDRFNTMVSIHCTKEEQVRRLKTYRSMSEADIMLRLNDQIPSHFKAAWANFPLDTNCSLLELKNRVENLHQFLKKGE